MSEIRNSDNSEKSDKIGQNREIFFGIERALKVKYFDKVSSQTDIQRRNKGYLKFSTFHWIPMGWETGYEVRPYTSGCGCRSNLKFSQNVWN